MWRNTGVNPNELLAWTGITSNTASAYAVAKSGGAVSFNDLSDDRALDVTVKTIAQQAGSRAPSPKHVRAISGKESVAVSIFGVNLFDSWSIFPAAPSSR